VRFNERVRPAPLLALLRALIVGPQGGLWDYLAEHAKSCITPMEALSSAHDEAEFGITSIASSCETVRMLLSSLALGTTPISCQPVSGSHLFRIIRRHAEWE